jgi:Tol biopolymer transport system component
LLARRVMLVYHFREEVAPMLLDRRIVRWTLTFPLALGMAGLLGGQTEPVFKARASKPSDTANGDSGTSSMSADGRYLVFISDARNLVPGQIDPKRTFDVFLYDRVAGTTVLVSHADGSPLRARLDESYDGVISADGRWVAFTNESTLPSGGVFFRVFLYERETGQITPVSRQLDSARPGDGCCASISADGSYISYLSLEADRPAEQPWSNIPSVFLYERASGSVRLLDHAAGSPREAGDVPDPETSWPEHVISADGRFVAFASASGNLISGQIDDYEVRDVFLFDRLTGETTQVSHAAGAPLTGGNGASIHPRLSADGRYLVFASLATNLVADVTDWNWQFDVFLYDRILGTLSLVNRSPQSPSAPTPNGGFAPVISADGNTIAYYEGRKNAGYIWIYDRPSGQLSFVARPSQPGSPAKTGTDEVLLSDNGRYVGFASEAVDLVSGQSDRGRTADLFLYDRATAKTVLVSHAAGLPTKTANGASFWPILSADGSWIAFTSFARDLDVTKRDANGSADVFLYETATGVNRVVSLARKP